MHRDNTRVGRRSVHSEQHQQHQNGRQNEQHQHHPSEEIGPAELASVMSHLARSWQRSHDSVDRTLTSIVGGAAGEIPRAERAGIVLSAATGWVATIATDPLAAQLDELQVAAAGGPTGECVRGEQTVRVDDLAAETRWPAFVEPARQLGLGSMLSLKLFVHDRVLGALNVYSSRPHAFDDESETVGLMFAAHAAIALAGAQHEENLERALDSRDLIGQAKGVLMERYKVRPDVAFAMLVASSQATHLKLRDVAYEVSSTGIVPEPRPRPSSATEGGARPLTDRALADGSQ